MKSVAEKLRELAREAEEAEQCGAGLVFTCNKVYFSLGREIEEAYAEAFGFGSEGDVCTGNAIDLWRSPDCASIRVLLLCFAAAMAETGDL